MFPPENMRKTFTVMHNSVVEYSDTLSFALLACIILYINGKQFRCSVFPFVQYNYTQIFLVRPSTTVAQNDFGSPNILAIRAKYCKTYLGYSLLLILLN